MAFFLLGDPSPSLPPPSPFSSCPFAVPFAGAAVAVFAGVLRLRPVPVPGVARGFFGVVVGVVVEAVAEVEAGAVAVAVAVVVVMLPLERASDSFFSL